MPNFDTGVLNGGIVGQLMREYDWTRSRLGHPSGWSQPLRTVSTLILEADAPMFLAWGEELCFLYNDAYLDVLGERHPAALGRPLREVWPEVWHEVEPLTRKIMAGESVRYENRPFTLRRNGADEQAWFSFVYAPVRDHDGKVGGLYCSVTDTTTQVLLEKRRQEETDRLYRLFAQAPSFMAVMTGPTHVYELTNDAHAQLVGQRCLIGKSVRDALPELEGQGFYEILDDVYRTGKSFVGNKLPVFLQREPGAPMEQRFVDFFYQPIPDVHGKVTGVFVVGHDVTSHKHIEEDLKCSEARAVETARMIETQQSRLNALLDAAPTGIVFADANGSLILANAENRRIWGEHPMCGGVDEYAEWKGWWADGSARHGQRIQPHEWGMARALRGEEVANDIVEIEPFDRPGERRTILLRGAPIRNAAGAITSAVIAQIDISDRVRAEGALRESEAKFRTMAESMPQMVWSTLPDGHHDYFNQKWYEYTGARDGATDGAEAWNEMVHPDHRRRAAERWRHALATGEQYEAEFQVRHCSGQYRWLLSRALPVRDGNGKIVRWMGTSTDIHEQKLAQDALRESDRRKDEFLAMLAHELRNPLAPIVSAADLLSMASDDGAEVRRLTGIVARHATHMTTLLDDLLDVSRVTHGLITLEKEAIDAGCLLAEAAEQVRPLMQARGHRLEQQLPPERLSVAGDKKRLVQVVANILVNAAKYTPNGGHIVLELHASDTQVMISVADNGVGMPPDLLARAFDLFVQGEQTSDRSQGGLGIGLALVKNLVELHGGTVAAHSDGPGAGSRFTVALPRLREDGKAGSDAAGSGGLRPADRPARVMVVDDNADAAQLMAMLLETFGYEVIVEYRGVLAIERAARAMPQICLLDIGLPDMKGTELARRLRALPGMESAVLAAVTGYGQPHDRAASEAAGFDYHFVKPVHTEKLLAWLGDVAGKRKLP